MRHIYWYCLDMSDLCEEFVSDALMELSDKLKQPPTEVAIMAEKLPDKYAEGISQLLCGCRDFRHTDGTITDILVRGLGLHFHGLLVYCREDSTIARAAREANPDALWGAQCLCLAAAWEPNNKMLIWHETLHLLGVEDCYDPVTKEGTCEKAPGCIMQYIATEETVADWPECLCLKTVNLLRHCASDPHAKN